MFRTGCRPGQVTWRNRCHAFAPSIPAASYRSSDTDWIPAWRNVVAMGYCHQTVANSTAYSARLGCDSHWMFGVGDRCRRHRM